MVELWVIKEGSTSWSHPCLCQGRTSTAAWVSSRGQHPSLHCELHEGTCDQGDGLRTRPDTHSGGPRPWSGRKGCSLGLDVVDIYKGGQGSLAAERNRESRDAHHE